MQAAIKFLRTKSTLTIMVPGRKVPFTVDISDPLYGELRSALDKKDDTKVVRLVNVADDIMASGKNRIVVKNGSVLYHGEVVDNSLTKRIIGLMSEGKPLSHMFQFMQNLYSNPTPHVLEELYDFLGNSNLPITDDGCFLAYKVISSDYKDKYTNSVDNSIGANIPRLDRNNPNQVNLNRHETCSKGYHFCSFSYVKSYFNAGDKIVVVKVNPKDVTSIPSDYSYTKGRCEYYEIVEEYGLATDATSTTVPEAKRLLTSVVELKKDRQALVSKLLNHPIIKRNLKKGSIVKTTITKSNYGKLWAIWQKIEKLDATTKEKSEKRVQKQVKSSALVITPAPKKRTKEVSGSDLKRMRESAHMSYTQMAGILKVGKSTIWSLERSEVSKPETIVRYSKAIEAFKHKNKM